MKNEDIAKYESKIAERFISYAKIETTSDPSAENRSGGGSPSSPCQMELLSLVEKELKDMGLKDVSVDKNGYLRAFMRGNTKGDKIFGFIAHADTSPEVPGKNVKPLLHKKYKGGKIVLKGAELDPAESPDLLKYKDQTIITSDGTTLLGADDKAGIAEIVTAVSYFLDHPEIHRNGMEIFITPDEEIGRGTDRFPLKKIRSSYLYTVDGGGEGIIEAECFNAYAAKIIIRGVSVHPGSGKGRFVNAALLASEFISMLPKQEMPETSEGREGFFCPLNISAGIEKSEIDLILRDFGSAGMERRIKIVEQTAEILKNIYPAAEFDVEFQNSYSNMRDFFEKDPQVLHILEEAVRSSGIEPVYKVIRGGTDGARLSEMGFPCPNIFTGGNNYHSRTEWLALPAMLRALDVIVNIVRTGL